MDMNNEAIRLQKRTRRNYSRKLRKRVLMALFILAVIITSIFTATHLIGKQPSNEANTPSEIGGIPVIADLLPQGIPGRLGQEMKIKHIVIHETGNTGSNANAEAHNSYIHKQAKETTLSWHYTVDDHEIYKHLPDNEVGFHAGDKFTENGGNMNGVGIEMCINPENDYEQTLKNTAELVRYLMTEYNLDINDVKKHQDFSGKVCPEGLILNNRWDEFIQIINDTK